MSFAVPANGMALLSQAYLHQQQVFQQQFVDDVNHNHSHHVFPAHGNFPLALNSPSFQLATTNEQRIDLEPTPIAEPSPTPQQHLPYQGIRIHHITQTTEQNPLMHLRPDLSHPLLPTDHFHHHHPHHFQSRINQQQLQPQQLEPIEFMFGRPMHPMGMGHLGMERSTEVDAHGDYQYLTAHEEGDDDYEYNGNE
jgi:hypothetical protein